MHNLDAFLARFGAEDLRGEFAAKWDAALAENPPAAYVDAFLAPKKVAAHWRMAPLRDDSLGPLQKMAERVRGDEWLLPLAAYMHWRIFQDRDTNAQCDWPAPKPLEGDDAALSHFLVALGFPPVFSISQRAFGIPDNILADSCRQIACYAYNYHRATGRPGIFLNQLSWLHVYMPPARYYRIGRLEYQSTTYTFPFAIYRRLSDGRTCALCRPGARYRPDGEACPAAGERPADAWEPCLDVRGDGVEGHPVRVDGRAARETVFLPAGEWVQALAPGDPVLMMHIPSGGGMSPDLARDSLRRAIPFFDRHFPDRPVRAIVCSSWIFSNQLVECLPPGSNILALQQMVHLLPLASSPSSGLWFVFLKHPPFDPATLPRDTSMRRALADWLAAGNVFHHGGMYLLREEVEGLKS